MLLPLQGDIAYCLLPRAMPWAKSFWAFSPCFDCRFSILSTGTSAPG